jgi:O-antigen/teichoic acid export membrane protein
MAQVIAVIAGYGVAGLPGSVIAGIIAGALFMVPLCRFRPQGFPRQTAEDIIRFSFWAFLACGGMVLYGNIDTILLGFYTSDTEVGLYRIAMQLASFALFSALALSTILYPRFVSWKQDERKAWIADSLARALSYSLLLALPVCAGGVLLGGRLLYYLYGSPYETAGTALVFLLTAQVVYVFVYLWTMTLNALGKPRDAAAPALTAVGINIPLNLLLIPVSGMNGAAAAILITVLVHAIYAGKLLGKQVSLFMDVRALRSIIIAVAGMTAVIVTILYFIPITHFLVLALTICTGGSVYFLILVRLERGINTALHQMTRDMGIIIPDWL